MGIFGYGMQSWFLWEQRPLLYNTHPYNNWSERAVEVPLAVDFLKRHATGKRILEVGNVLSHYGPISAQCPGVGQVDIIDKFEQQPGVINIDLMDVSHSYDIILSISTMEHIGQQAYGESKHGDLEAPLKAIAKVYDLLNPGGLAFITVPFGRLTYLGWLIQFGSKYLAALQTKFGIPRESIRTWFFKKIDMEIKETAPRQYWVQCKEDELRDTLFGSPFVLANGIAVIQLEKGRERRPNEQLSVPLRYYPPVIIGEFYYTPFWKKASDALGWFSASEAGFVFYGPYVTLRPQVYRFEVTLEVRGAGPLVLEVTSHSGNKVLWSRVLNSSERIRDLLYVKETEPRVEVRLFKPSASPCQVRVPRLLLVELF
ncbi:class I SAM-dependent methyltransferase [Paenibacillus senegalensis]|uniref:class I SAM-dependent methyltransferase n=1 Tax=Paenibacillus senegalensis TaxID=1465766 RepID=UPI000287EFDB|nr:DUF268 domain-containing protein [Paenibacillus senegalensis]